MAVALKERLADINPEAGIIAVDRHWSMGEDFILGENIDYKIKLGKWEVRTSVEAKYDFKLGDEVTFYLSPEDIIVTREK